MHGKRMPVQSAVELIKDGDTISVVGFTMMGASETVLKEIERSFKEQGKPGNLTLFHCAGQSDRVGGLQRLGHKGLVKKVVGAHWGLAPGLSSLIHTNEIEAHCIPQGQAVHLARAMAAGKPGNLSKVGLGTFIDPRIEGGLMNDRSKEAGCGIEVVELGGEEYLFYKAVPIDVAIIRGTTADEFGNVTMEDEGVLLEALSVAQAAKRYGGKVIVQVKNYAKRGTLHPKSVVVPGIFVDAIVVSDNPEMDHRLTASIYHDPIYTGDVKVPNSSLAPLPLNIRKIVGRRGALELFPGAIINLGIGFPGDTIGPIASEEGVLNDLLLTVESGVIGGMPSGSMDFGICKNPEAIIDHGYQFDYYNGAGVDITFMGTAEVDVAGNVNVSKFGTRAVGSGGFIDITQPAKKVVFLCTFTNGGLEIEIKDGKLHILKEGESKKFVKSVGQITFSGAYARKARQPVLYVTERAVFRLGDQGVELIEYAPGIDIEKHILHQMEFKPILSPDLKEMSAEIFRDAVMNFKAQFANKS